MRKPIKIAIGAIPIICCLLYGGGYIAQFIKNYSEWQKAGGSIGSGTSPAFPSPGISECLKTVFTMPYGLYGLIICAGVLAVLVFMIMKMGDGDLGQRDKERNFDYSNKGTYGTSGFMSESEMREVFEVDSVKNNDGILLGLYNDKPLFLPRDTFMNKNIAVFGASGSMKSRAFVRNYIFQATRRMNGYAAKLNDKTAGITEIMARGESLVITDPKSEIYEDMAEFLKTEGYDVKVFNLVSPQNSDSWNCIADIEGDDLLAQTFTDVVIRNTTVGQGDEFWDSASVNLLKALVLYVSVEYDEETCNIGEAYKLISLRSATDLDAMFSTLDYTHPAFAPYNIFKQASDNVRSGIIIGLGARLQVFQNEMIRNITSYNEINLVDAGKRKSAYFCITSDQESTFDFLASLFFSFLFIRLVRFADTSCEGGKLTVPVNMVLDEMPNIGSIPDLTKKISTIRSRAINMSVIFQNLAQLQNRYPNGAWEEILGGCDTMLFLGCTDTTTAKYISDRTGEVTVSVASKTKNLNSWRVSDYTPEYREAKSIGKRKLLTPDEVLRLPIKEALVMMRGQKILKVKKYDYTLHPYATKLVRKKASCYVPAWRRNEEQINEDSEAVNENITKEEQKRIPKMITFNIPETQSEPLPEQKKEEKTEQATELIVQNKRPKAKPINLDDLDVEGGDEDVPKRELNKVAKSTLKID